MSLKGIRKKDNPDYVQRKNVNGSTYYKKIEDPNKGTTMRDNLDDYSSLLEYEFSNEDYEIIDHNDIEDDDLDDIEDNSYDDTETKEFDAYDPEDEYMEPDNDQSYDKEHDQEDQNVDNDNDEVAPRRVVNVKEAVINFFDKYKYPIMIGTGTALALGAVGAGIFVFTNFIVVS